MSAHMHTKLAISSAPATITANHVGSSDESAPNEE